MNGGFDGRFAAVGAGIGIATGNLAVGIGAGLVFSVAIGIARSRRA